MTSTDERLERYLHDRSSTIDLPHAGVGDITRRARRHRRRRTAAVGGMAAAVLLGGTAIALRQPAPEEEVGSMGAAVVDSPLEWNVVPVQVGLGWGSAATSDGSAVYSLSTAPGPEEDGSWHEPRHLYRSEDGTDWEDVGLPEGLYASSLASGDGTVYAVGTAAAGGEAIGVELAASTDGGAGWDTSSVPVDLAALADGFPGTVRVTDAEVAVSGSTTVVAVSTGGQVDVASVLPAGEDPEQWYQEQDGLVRPAGTTCGGDVQTGETTTVPATAPPATEDPATTTPPAADNPAPTTAPPVGADGRGICRDEEPVNDLLSWADLGLTAEQVAVAQGQTHLFVADADGALVPVETLDGTSAWVDPSQQRLLAADDGFWLVTETVDDDDPSDGIGFDQVGWHSADGQAWTSTPLGGGRNLLTAGVAAGRLLLVTSAPGTGQEVQVHRVEAGGAVTTTDVNELVGVPSGAGIYAYAVGPLGVAVVLGEGASGEDDTQVLVHSLDGLQFSRQDLPAEEAGTRESVNGITITPDAIKVRLNVRDEADLTGATPAAQRLLVGTPAG